MSDGAQLAPARVLCRPMAARQRQLLVAQSAAAAGAGGINDDNKERVVKGNVGEPSKAQPTVRPCHGAVSTVPGHQDTPSSHLVTVHACGICQSGFCRLELNMTDCFDHGMLQAASSLGATSSDKPTDVNDPRVKTMQVSYCITSNHLPPTLQRST